MRYIRFQAKDIDVESGALIGVIRAAIRLRDAHLLLPEHEAYLAQILAWFNVELPRPGRFSLRRARDGIAGPSDAVCWFKDQAREHLKWAQALVALVSEYGVQVVRCESPQPGYIVYEDAFQVAAVPHGRARHSAPRRRAH